MPTLIHRRVAAAQRGENPTVICRVRSGWIVLGDALLAATNAYLINYEILGNKDHALHAHVRPRYEDEPEGRHHKHPFRYQADPAVPFDERRDAELMTQICDELRRRGSLL